MHGFIPLDRLLRRQKCPKSQPRIHTAFEKAMILFHRIIQIFALPQGTRLPERSILLEGLESGRIGSVAIYGDDPRQDRMGRASHFAEKALRCPSIPART
jgi:hypothetical protein